MRDRSPTKGGRTLEKVISTCTHCSAADVLCITFTFTTTRVAQFS